MNIKKIYFPLIIIAGIIILSIALIFKTVLDSSKVIVQDVYPFPLDNEVEEIKQKNIIAPRNRFYSYIDTIFELMNSKDYETMYSLLKEDYKAAEFSNLSNFINFMEKYTADAPFQARYTSYFKEGPEFVAVVEILKDNYTRDDLITPPAMLLDIFSVRESETGFTFSLNGFINSTNKNEEVKNNYIVLKLTKLDTYYDKSVAYVSISNLTSSDIIINRKNIIYPSGLGTSSISSTLNEQVYKISANSTSDFKFTYSVGLYEKQFLPDALIFKDIVLNNQKYTFELPLK